MGSIRERETERDRETEREKQREENRKWGGGGGRGALISKIGIQQSLSFLSITFFFFLPTRAERCNTKACSLYGETAARHRGLR